MTDRYTFRVSYVIDVDVEIDRSEEAPNDRRTGNYEALNYAAKMYAPSGARELVVATVRHLAMPKPAAPPAEQAAMASLREAVKVD